jgi:hypothetical protein
MRKLLATLTLTAALFGMTAVPAQAHYDPWQTHSHCNSFGCYRSCSWWDSMWGCKSVYYVIW